MTFREYSFQIINKSISGGYTSELLKDKPALSEADFSLSVKIIYGTLSNLLYLDYQWEDFKKGKVPLKIRNLIDSALYQLIFLDKVPSYAVLNETVNIAKKYGYASLVNGILRNYLRRGVKDIEIKGNKDLSIKYSLPLWLVNLWEKQYGKDICVLLCRDNIKEKKTCFRVNSKHNRDDFLNDNLLKGNLTDISLIALKNPLNEEGFKQGIFNIQDEASQLVTMALDIKGNEKILELCAAPGTKSLHMSELLDKGEILAVDVSESRLQKLDKVIKEKNIKNIKTMCLDARKINEEITEEFDIVCVDAPCSGLGVLKDKPDIKLRITPEKLDELVLLQREILFAAKERVKNGGYLLYSTCTLNRKENDKQMSSFLKDSDFVKIKERTVFPYEDNNDGFYFCLVKRV